MNSRGILAESTPPTDQVSSIMSTKLVTVKATESVSNALRKMIRHKIGSIVAIEKGEPIGILTERDISIKVGKAQSLRGLVVKKTMSKPLITIGPSAGIWEAVEQMVRREIRRLPVIESGKLVGMVTERDILRWFLEVAYAPRIPADLKKLLETRAQAHSLT
jgi:CBS domain-containing protein